MLNIFEVKRVWHLSQHTWNLPRLLQIPYKALLSTDDLLLHQVEHVAKGRLELEGFLDFVGC